MKDLFNYEQEVARRDAFPVKFLHFKQLHHFRPHWHAHIELLFFKSGNATVYCNETEIPVKPGDLAVLNKTEVHTMQSKDGCDYYCIQLFPQFFTDIALENILLQNHIPGDKSIIAMMQSIYSEFNSARPGRDMMLKSHAYAIMAYLLRNYTTAQLSKKDSQLLAQKARRMDRVLDYIDRFYAEKLSTHDLAELCHLNESYFCRLFKKATGKSVLGYISEYRIEKAAELLKNTTDSIADVAAAVGFDDITYFGRCFKNAKGTSPMQYRKRL